MRRAGSSGGREPPAHAAYQFAMADDIFSTLLTELSEEMHPFKSQIVDREQVLCGLALARQKRVAIAQARIERKFIDGVGEMVASIDAEVYHRLAHIHGGYGVINDWDFMSRLLRDNPEVRIKSRSTRTGIFVPCDWKENIERDVATCLTTTAEGIAEMDLAPQPANVVPFAPPDFVETSRFA